MHLFFDPNNSVDWQSVFENFEKSQFGSGETNPDYFRPRGYIGFQNQRGSGIGGILSRLFSFLIPIAKAASRTIGSEALLASGEIATDLAAGRNLNDSLKDRSAKAYNRLVEKAATKVQMGRGKTTKNTKTSKKSKVVKKRKPSGKTVKKTKKVKKISHLKNRKKSSAINRVRRRNLKDHSPLDIFG